MGFRGQNIQYQGFNVFESINSLGSAVIGGLGYVLGAVFAAAIAISRARPSNTKRCRKASHLWGAIPWTR